MRIRSLASAVAGLAAVAAVLTGCAVPAAGPGYAPTATPTPSDTGSPGEPGDAADGVYPLTPALHPHVQLSCPLIPAIHYDPVDLPPAGVDAVYSCTSEPWTDAADGTPQRIEYVDRVATPDVAGLLAAYAVADEPRPLDVMCTFEYPDPLIVWIHAGGRIVAVYAPQDECGKPSAPAAAARDAVELHRVLVAREKEGTTTSGGLVPWEVDPRDGEFPVEPDD